MNKITFGQYYNGSSFFHKLDPRTKLIGLLLLMISIFVIDINNNGFIYLGILFFLVILFVLLSNVPLRLYFRSLRQIMFLLIFSFVFQLLFNRGGGQLEFIPQIDLKLTITNICIVILIFVIYIYIKKYIPFKFTFFLIVITLMVVTLNYPIYGKVFKVFTIKIYKDGVVTGFFVIARVFILIMFSSILTLTTKPTDLNNGLESLLKPFEYIGLKTSILAMMISITLRYIPTLFNETDKILKAQASRGVDFNEGKLREKIVQIISLLIPMFVISFKRATELSDAMEARGYIPGEKRTKINIMKYKIKDILSLIFLISLTTLMIVGRFL